jgi:hypothetical protein
VQCFVAVVQVLAPEHQKCWPSKFDCKSWLYAVLAIPVTLASVKMDAKARPICAKCWRGAKNETFVAAYEAANTHEN